MGRTNKPIQNLSMIAAISGDTLTSNAGSQSSFSFSRAVATSDTLKFVMEDSSGLRNSNPFTFTIDAQQNELHLLSFLIPQKM
ncbi:MAG: hypothetical protein U5K69_07905 [Balneolaceae bacterium]|nr:hypothetical protein [Balneolaceae bacterium]